MVDRDTLNVLIIKIKQVRGNLENINSQLLEKSLTESVRRRLYRERNLHSKKLKFYLNRLKNLGKGNIVKIIFLEGDIKRVAYYTNISPNEAKELLKFYYLMNNISIKILEIKDIKTSIY